MENIRNNSEEALDALDDPTEEYSAEIEVLTEKIKQIWGVDLDRNKLLAKRALSWLGMREGMTSLEEVDEITFINRLVDLGILLSEDKSLSTSSDEFGANIEEAKKIRTNLSSNKDFIDALYRKSHIGHKEAVHKLNTLNRIIASNK